MIRFEYMAFGGVHNLTLRRRSITKGKRISIAAWEIDEAGMEWPYGPVTVELDVNMKNVPLNRAFVNTEGFPGILSVLFEKQAGKVVSSVGGFPLFEFTDDFLRRLDSDEDEEEDAAEPVSHMEYRTCPMCGTESTMELTPDEIRQYELYLSGDVLLQEAFTGLNPAEREFMKTGYCLDCQRKIFGSRVKSKRVKAEG